MTRVIDREHGLGAISRILQETPRTGIETAVCVVGLDRPADEIDAAAHELAHVLRAGDLVVHSSDSELIIVLHGVHDLPNALQVLDRMTESAQVALRCERTGNVLRIGITLVRRGEALDSVIARAQGALEMARDADLVVMTSPPL